MTNFREQLALADFMCDHFGGSSINDFRSELSSVPLEITTQGTTNFYESFEEFDTDFDQEKLRQYDQNIVEYQRRLNELRDQPITLKYFQYLAAIFTERYLDWYFTDSEGLLSEFDDFIEELNENQMSEDHRHFSPTAEDLDKLAFWMATGSGKTLLMHINLWQFNRYNTDQLDNIVLITPNEGLTHQHIQKFKQSGIKPRRLDPDRTRNSKDEIVVDVVDIHKLREESGEKTISTDTLEGNNLVFIDEGHKGASGDEWFQRREEVIDEGFAFEYSATFGQALSVTNNKNLQQEYSKSIIFDYSYRYFHEDGYGKDYQILNISDVQISDTRRRFLVGNLLAFYEQKVYFDGHPDVVQDYNIEDPLWIFVGRTVSSSSSTQEFQERTSDVLEAVEFFDDVLSSPERVIDDIGVLLSGDAEITTDEHEDIFSDRFTYLRELGWSAEEIYENLVQRVFNGTSGEGVELVDLTGVDSEVALRAAGSDAFFGVINIGDTAAFLDTASESNSDIPQEENVFKRSLFENIDSADSKVNVLLGAKKFVEGWDSMRVSSMGLMNVGRSKGSEIIQMFGRGVRLLGKDRTLKRSSHLEEEAPSNLSLLETLNVFGIRADYIKRFEEYLQKEDIPVGYHERTVETDVSDDLLSDSLKNPRINTRAEYTDAVELANDNQYSPEINLYPDVDVLSSTDLGGAHRDERSHTIDPGILSLLSWDSIYFDMLDYKRTEDLSNLKISQDTLKQIVIDEQYHLYTPEEYVVAESMDDLERVERVIKTILRSYIDNFYFSHRSEWENKQREVTTLTSEDPNLDFGGITLRAPSDKDDLVDAIDQLAANASELYDAAAESSYPVVFLDRHLYQPQFVQDDFSTVSDDRVRTSPPSLNTGETDFIRRLRTFIESERPELHQKVYLLRNLSKGNGIGFAEGGGFYPDFIMWIITDDQQYVTFIDPHGMVFSAGLSDPKVQLSTRIKDIEEKLGEDELTLSSFIISRTNWTDLQTENSKQDFLDNNVLFREEDYIEQLFEKLGV